MKKIIVGKVAYIHKKSGKRADIVSNKTIAYLIGIIALIVIIGIVIKLNPNFLYKLLPKYGVPEEVGDIVITDQDLLISGCGVDGIVVAKQMQGFTISIIESVSSKVLKSTNLEFKSETDRSGVTTRTLVADPDGGRSVKSVLDVDWREFEVGTIDMKGKVTINFPLVAQKFLIPKNTLNFNVDQLLFLEGSSYKSSYFCGSTDDLVEKWNKAFLGISSAHVTPVSTVSVGDNMGLGKTPVFSSKYAVSQQMVNIKLGGTTSTARLILIDGKVTSYSVQESAGADFSVMIYYRDGIIGSISSVSSNNFLLLKEYVPENLTPEEVVRIKNDLKGLQGYYYMVGNGFAKVEVQSTYLMNVY